MATQADRFERNGHGRRVRFPVAALLAIVVLGSACASSSPMPQGGSTRYTRIDTDAGVYELEITKDRSPSLLLLAETPAAVWAALPAAYAALGLQGGVVDAARRIFGRPRRQSAPKRIADERLGQFLNCGYGVAGSKADTYDVGLAIVTRIDSTAEGSAVLTWVDAVAKPRDVSSALVECGTNGKLEQLLVDSLQAHVRR